MSSKMVVALGMIAVMAMATGCTTAMIRLPDGTTVIQPKDTSFNKLTCETTEPNGTKHVMIVDKYSSNANQAVITQQMDMISSLVGAGATLATKAVVK